jgi:hypothetical protein
MSDSAQSKAKDYRETEVFKCQVAVLFSWRRVYTHTTGLIVEKARF